VQFVQRGRQAGQIRLDGSRVDQAGRQSTTGSQACRAKQRGRYLGRAGRQAGGAKQGGRAGQTGMQCSTCRQTGNHLIAGKQGRADQVGVFRQ
jgi:hypothetical protein